MRPARIRNRIAVGRRYHNDRSGLTARSPQTTLRKRLPLVRFGPPYDLCSTEFVNELSRHHDLGYRTTHDVVSITRLCVERIHCRYRESGRGMRLPPNWIFG
jgi:hypothetical protein